MAKNVYIGVSGKARKTKNIYVGVGGKARKVKKGYIGIGGKARLFYLASGQIVKSFDDFLDGLGSASASNANYALFAGGGYNYHNDAGTNVCKAVDKSLTVSTATSLTYAKYYLAASNIGNYVIFGGGISYTGGSDGNAVFRGEVLAYDTSLTVTTLSDKMNIWKYAAAKNSNYAFFAGGDTYEYGGKPTNIVYKYNSSLTRSSDSLKSNVKNLGSATVNDYVLFAGGQSPGSNGDIIYRNSVSAFNTSGTMSSPSALSVARCSLAGGTINNRALFIGGESASSSYKQTVESYNSSLTKYSMVDFPVACKGCVAANTDDKLLIGGGEWDLDEGTNYYRASSRIYSYNNSFTCSLHSVSLLNTRWGMTATTFGSYALFGSGKVNNFNTFGSTDHKANLVVFN